MNSPGLTNERIHQNTPLGIEIALFYHYSPGQYRGGDFSAPAVRECIDDLINRGLLIDGAVPQPNREALAVYVDALCSVHLPIQRWVVP